MCDISAYAIAQTSFAISVNLSKSIVFVYALKPAKIIFGLCSWANLLSSSKSISQFSFVLYLIKLNTFDMNVTGAQCVRCHQ